MDLVPSTPKPASTLSEQVMFAKALADASLLPESYRRQPSNVLYALQAADALGIHPMTAIQQVHVIKGKPSMSAELMRALVQRAGHRFRIVESTSQVATVEIVRADDPEFPQRFSFSMDDATRAKLTGKDSWRTFPTAMLLARATSSAVRAVCPDVLMGISYVPEEIGADVDADGEPVGHIDHTPDDMTEREWTNYCKRQLLDACGGNKELAASLWRPVADDHALLALLEEASQAIPPAGVADDLIPEAQSAFPPGDGDSTDDSSVVVAELVESPEPDDDDTTVENAPADDEPRVDADQRRTIDRVLAENTGRKLTPPEKRTTLSAALGRDCKNVADVTAAEYDRLLRVLEGG